MVGRGRVLIADRDHGQRAVIRSVLQRGGFEVCAEASDGERAVVLARRVQPDAVVLALSLPGEGLKTALRIHATLPSVAAVMVAPDDERLYSALCTEVSGYVLTDTVPQALVPTLEAVFNDGAVIPPCVMARIVHDVSPSRRVAMSAGARTRLTDRQAEVLEMLAAGLTSAEMAKRLGVLPVTVRTHVAAVLRKLGAPDRETAVRLYSER